MKKFFAVIGDPIAHSMSPQMHNDLFQHYAIDAHYQPLLVKREGLHDAILGLKAIGVSGFNVTIPHKTEILQYLDEVDTLAEKIGAVNTVINKGGKFIGYNTDGLGFLTGLTSIYHDVKDRNILIIGAGGAARAIYFTLAKIAEKSIHICNRTIEKAELLIQECPYKINSKAISISAAEENLYKYEIIIQTTNIGMAPLEKATPLSLDRLKEGTLVSDIIYNPLETVFLNEAKKKNTITQNGIDMFIHQGALAFKYWTGIEPDLVRMKNNVLKQLGGNIC